VALAPKGAAAVEVEDRFDAEMADYQRAVDDYRLGRFPEAVRLLRAFVDRYPTSTVLDDAWFIEASSLASEGLAEEAAEVAEAHLARFPTSFHRKQAAILVARGRRDRGDCEGARAALAPWSGDPSTLSELGRCNR
jgi:TolA-binding protein